jgi:hypothetical protein
VKPLYKRTVSRARPAGNREAEEESTRSKGPEGGLPADIFALDWRVHRVEMERAGIDLSEFDDDRRALIEDWQPSDAQQQTLVEDLAWQFWLWRRVFLTQQKAEAEAKRRIEVERERRRLRRARPVPPFNPEEHAEHGCLFAKAPGRFPAQRRLLDDLAGCVRQAVWDDAAEGAKPRHWIRLLYGAKLVTPRGRCIDELWQSCVADAPGPDDARAHEILRLIAEERAIVDDEESLDRRRQELEERNDAAAAALYPLSKGWPRTFSLLERIDRRTEIKLRLLMRLKDSQSPVPPRPPAPESKSKVLAGNKPSSSNTGYVM